MTTLETTQHQKTPLNSRLSGVNFKQLLPILLSLAQRLAFGIVVLLVIAYLSFLGLEMACGTAFNAALLDGVEKTIVYLGKLVQGDLGVTAAGSVTLRPVPIGEVVSTTMVPILTTLGVSLRISLSSLPVVEYFFGWQETGVEFGFDDPGPRNAILKSCASILTYFDDLPESSIFW